MSAMSAALVIRTARLGQCSTAASKRHCSILDEGVEFNVFVETTRWLGLKIRLQGQNVLNLSQLLDRTVFVGQRGLSSVDFRELQDSKDGRRVIMALSGSF